MSKELNKYKVTIDGESYFLVTDQAEERILEIARYVDNEIRAIAQAGHSDDPQRLAILVALQSTSKMMESSQLLKVHQEHTERMIEYISQEVPQKVSIAS